MRRNQIVQFVVDKFTPQIIPLEFKLLLGFFGWFALAPRKAFSKYDLSQGYLGDLFKMHIAEHVMSEAQARNVSLEGQTHYVRTNNTDPTKQDLGGYSRGVHDHDLSSLQPEAKTVGEAQEANMQERMDIFEKSSRRTDVFAAFLYAIVGYLSLIIPARQGWQTLYKQTAPIPVISWFAGVVFFGVYCLERVIEYAALIASDVVALGTLGMFNTLLDYYFYSETTGTPGRGPGRNTIYPLREQWNQASGGDRIRMFIDRMMPNNWLSRPSNDGYILSLASTAVLYQPTRICWRTFRDSRKPTSLRALALVGWFLCLPTFSTAGIVVASPGMLVSYLNYLAIAGTDFTKAVLELFTIKFNGEKFARSLIEGARDVGLLLIAAPLATFLPYVNNLPTTVYSLAPLASFIGAPLFIKSLGYGATYFFTHGVPLALYAAVCAGVVCGINGTINYVLNSGIRKYYKTQVHPEQDSSDDEAPAPGGHEPSQAPGSVHASRLSRAPSKLGKPSKRGSRLNLEEANRSQSAQTSQSPSDGTAHAVLTIHIDTASSLVTSASIAQALGNTSHASQSASVTIHNGNGSMELEDVVEEPDQLPMTPALTTTSGALPPSFSLASGSPRVTPQQTTVQLSSLPLSGGVLTGSQSQSGQQDAQTLTTTSASATSPTESLEPNL